MKYSKAHLEDTAHGHIVRFIFKCEDQAIEVAKTLIRYSAWFDITPLPEDEWVVEVRKDKSRFVEHLLRNSD